MEIARSGRPEASGGVPAPQCRAGPQGRAGCDRTFHASPPGATVGTRIPPEPAPPRRRHRPPITYGLQGQGAEAESRPPKAPAKPGGAKRRAWTRPSTLPCRSGGGRRAWDGTRQRPAIPSSLPGEIGGIHLVEDRGLGQPGTGEYAWDAPLPHGDHDLMAGRRSHWISSSVSVLVYFVFLSPFSSLGFWRFL